MNMSPSPIVGAVWGMNLGFSGNRLAQMAPGCHDVGGRDTELGVWVY